MAMLAERKRKQKWSLNPRGKDWSQDNNKFGQKMLEKMGWTNGKGLGAKESGITENIKIAYKNDSKGMGFKENNDQWTEHETNFSALLESLGESNDSATKKANEDVQLSSLEKKSQSSRVRVHYHKFTRGKDLSRYSEKDLANIFGKKTLKQSTNQNKEETVEETSESGKFTTSSGSMLDYFKKKIPNFGKVNGFSIGYNGVLKKEESGSESEGRSGFGFGFKQNSEENVPHVGLGFNSVKTEYSEKITKNDGEVKSTFVSYIKEQEITDNIEVNSVMQTETSFKKKRKAKDDNEDETPKKKKKKDKKVVEEIVGLSNPAFDPLFSHVPMEKHILNTIEESVVETIEPETSFENSETNSSTKKKKKKNKQNCDNNESNNETTLENSVNANEETGNKKKKLKKQLVEIGLDNAAFISFPATEESPEIQPNSEQKANSLKKKKTKKNKKENGIENPFFNDSEISPEVIAENVPKKKKKSKKSSDVGLENPVFNSNLKNESFQKNSNLAENPFEVKVKKSKKKAEESSFAIDNPIFDANDSIVTEQTVSEEFEVKRKKKKSKKNKPIEEKGLDNPCLNLNDSNVSQIEENPLPECDLMMNIVSTPITKVETNKTPSKNIFSSAPKSNGVKRRKSVRFSDVTQERIIPNNYDLQNVQDIEKRNELYEINSLIINKSLEDEAMRNGAADRSFDMTSIDQVSFYNEESTVSKKKKRKLGLDNAAFDEQSNNLQENIETISKTIDRYQAEIENDINEAKLKTVQVADVMVGEVGAPEGENEKLPHGTKLKFRYANFGRVPNYAMAYTGPKKSYKHLIKGDILLEFQNSNLHEIHGYATKNPKK